jgi:hypothetical protein
MSNQITARKISKTEAISKHNMYYADMLQYIIDTTDYMPVLDEDESTVRDFATRKILGHVVEYTCPECGKLDAWLLLIGWEDEDVCCSNCSAEFKASEMVLVK